MAYYTSLNFSYRLLKESLLKAKTCSKYLTPPWINFVDFELAPDEKSFFYISNDLNPRVAASRSTPVPLHPPPITTMSY
jgi:hypothetical protein